MGFWSSLGGVISTVTSWAKDAAMPIANVVKKVGSWMRDVGQVTEAHLEGRNIVMEDDSFLKRIPAKNHGNNDFIWDADDQLISEKQNLLIRIEEQNSKISKIDKNAQGTSCKTSSPVG